MHQQLEATSIMSGINKTCQMLTTICVVISAFPDAMLVCSFVDLFVCLTRN